MFECVQIYPNVVWTRFDNRSDLVQAFTRIQEYYESPKFKGKVFSQSEFYRWFLETYHMSYEEEWEGFNVPYWVVEEVFGSGKFSPLNIQEKTLHHELSQFSGQPFYLIGSLKGDTETLNHELSHAFFFLDQEFKDRVHQILWLAGPQLSHIKAHLLSMGYCDDVIPDELQAYLIHELPYLADCGISVAGLGECITDLNKAYVEVEGRFRDKLQLK